MCNRRSLYTLVQKTYWENNIVDTIGTILAREIIQHVFSSHSYKKYKQEVGFFMQGVCQEFLIHFYFDKYSRNHGIS